MATDDRRCFFCQSDDSLTDEHIWGEWTKPYVPRPHNKHDFHDIRVPTPGNDQTAETRIRAGDPLSSNVRVVCKRCNSGWMSQIQERAKPYLIPLFKGHFHPMNRRAQTAVAAWAAMAAMTSEHLARKKPGSIVTTDPERKWLMEYRFPPNNWRIWLGRYKREKWRGQWVRVTLPVLPEKQLAEAVKLNVRVPPNIQTITFIVGELYITTLSGEFQEIIDLWNWSTEGRAHSRLRQIWPITGDYWHPPPVGISDTEAEPIAVAFKRYSDDLAKRVGYTSID